MRFSIKYKFNELLMNNIRKVNWLKDDDEDTLMKITKIRWWRYFMKMMMKILLLASKWKISTQKIFPSLFYFFFGYFDYNEILGVLKIIDISGFDF